MKNLILVTFVSVLFISCQDTYTHSFCNSRNQVELDLDKFSFQAYSPNDQNNNLYNLKVEKTEDGYLLNDGSRLFNFKVCRLGFKVFAEVELEKFSKFFLVQITNNFLTGPYYVKLLNFNEKALRKYNIPYKKNFYTRSINVHNQRVSKSALFRTFSSNGRLVVIF